MLNTLLFIGVTSAVSSFLFRKGINKTFAFITCIAIIILGIEIKLVSLQPFLTCPLRIFNIYLCYIHDYLCT